MPRKTTIKSTESTPTVNLKDGTLDLTQEEIDAILAAREAKLNPAPVSATPTISSSGVSELAQALVTAINITKPVEKKTIMNRKKQNPWMPKDGSPKIMTFKRPMYHHGIEIVAKHTKNEWCELLEQIRPGKYCSGLITVRKRKDNGYDIDYPIRTQSQRLKVISAYGGGDFGCMLKRLIEERGDPKKYAKPEDEDND